MNFEKAVRTCHVRSGIFRRGQHPRIVYGKNHETSLEDRVPMSDQFQDDWEEFDPEDDYSIRG